MDTNKNNPKRDLSSDQDLLRKVKWLTIIRIIVASLILGSITVLQFKETRFSFSPFYNLIAIIYSMTLLYSLIIYFDPNPVFFAYIQLTGDIIVETALIFYTGGIRSPFAFTYIFTILCASILLSRKSSLIVATLSSLFYSLTIIFQFTKIWRFPLSYIPTGSQLTFPYVSHTLFANIFAFFLTAFLSGYLAELQRQAGRELKTKDGNIAQLQAFNENILQSLSSGLIVTDLYGNTKLMNWTARKIFNLPGFSQEHWDILFHPLKIEKFFHKMKHNKLNYLRIESHIKKRKKKIYLGITISFLKNTQGIEEGLITNFQDLTELKKMEEQVKQAEMLATIGQMAAVMAHELRNPMASIKGSVQFLDDELQLDQEHKRLMQIILKESNRLNNIITDFLQYAKPKPPSKVECNIADLIQETIALIQNSLADKQHIQIITDISPSLPLIDIDPEQIKQVFWNLAINSCQAMPSGGIFQILAHKTKDKDLLIEFTDTGVGISKEKINRLFHPFYTTKDKGMGLGLSIAYRIIKDHKGKIEVMSTSGEGSNFRVLLPYNSKILQEAVTTQK